VNFDLTYSFMLPMLQWMQGVTHSWGWSIVGLTLLVRIAVAPLVQSSTLQMKKMSQLQPQIKALQDKYKTDPEQLQKRLMEFYGKNKMNPLGGCLPMLVQLPILWALYAAFSGPPFMDKPIVVPIKVVAASDAAKVHRDETSKATVPYVSPDGAMAKLAVFPGELTLLQGQSTDFAVRAVQGKLDGALTVGWKVVPQGSHADPNKIPFTEDNNFRYDFTTTGEYNVEAKVPGVAAHDGFLFINSLGKIAKGFELLQPKNWDILFLIIAFGGTTYLSSLFSVSGGQNVPESEMTETQLIQKQTMKMMPLTMTAMFCFIPLPAGVFLYFVISNLFQVVQTWWLMKQPVAAIVAVGDEDGEGGGGGGGGKVKRSGGPQEPPAGRSKPDSGAGRKSADSSGGQTSTISTSSGQPKAGATIDLNDNQNTVEAEKRKSKKKKK
jgi:YidC/Oxa1 family membrane protein insertase